MINGVVNNVVLLSRGRKKITIINHPRWGRGRATARVIVAFDVGLGNGGGDRFIDTR